VLLLIPVLLILAGIVVYFVGNAIFSTEKGLQANWGISVPEGLREVEHYEESSFHGDGYRLTIYEVQADISLNGTFFDYGDMDREGLTEAQVALIENVTNQFDPKNGIAIPPREVYKRQVAKFGGILLCLYDATENKFFLYEEIL
jgi:hypothetical protein